MLTSFRKFDMTKSSDGETRKKSLKDNIQIEKASRSNWPSPLLLIQK